MDIDKFEESCELEYIDADNEVYNKLDELLMKIQDEPMYGMKYTIATSILCASVAGLAGGVIPAVVGLGIGYVSGEYVCGKIGLVMDKMNRLSSKKDIEMKCIVYK